MSYNSDITPIRQPVPVRNAEFRTRKDRNAEDAPRPTRDFKKVLEKSDDEENARKVADQDGEYIEEADEQAKKKNRLSPFEINTPKKPLSETLAGQLASANSPLRKTLMDQSAAQAAAAKDNDEQMDSPNSLFSKLSKSSAKKEGSSSLSEENAIAAERDVHSKYSDDSSTDADASGGGSSSLYSTEQGDLSYVNPLAATAGSSVGRIDASNASTYAHKVDMQHIINQLVDKVYLMQDQGKTETTVILKEPPMFAGASIVVTSFDSAKGEFNIAFQNLTQAAKHILDMRINQENLRMGLEQKGYAVHIVTTTTLAGTIPVEVVQSSDDRQRQNDGQNQEREPKKQKK